MLINQFVLRFLAPMKSSYHVEQIGLLYVQSETIGNSFA